MNGIHKTNHNGWSEEVMRDTLYNVEVRKNDEEYVVTACEHWTYEFLVGKGKTKEEAIKNMKRVVNMYDAKFKGICKEIEDNYTLVKK